MGFDKYLGGKRENSLIFNMISLVFVKYRLISCKIPQK